MLREKRMYIKEGRGHVQRYDDQRELVPLPGRN